MSDDARRANARPVLVVRFLIGCARRKRNQRRDTPAFHLAENIPGFGAAPQSNMTCAPRGAHSHHGPH